MATFLCYGIFTGNTNHQKVKIGTTCLELNTKAMASSVPGLGLGAPSKVFLRPVAFPMVVSFAK